MSQSIYLRIGLGLLIALVLSILPLPGFLSLFRPPFVLLFVLFIEYYLPEYFKLGSLLLIGLVLDVLLSTVIGEHAFALILVSWMASTKARRFQFFSLMQQLGIVANFCFIYQLIISLIDFMLGFQYSMVMPIASALFSMLFWPWIRVLGEIAFGNVELQKSY